MSHPAASGASDAGASDAEPDPFGSETPGDLPLDPPNSAPGDQRPRGGSPLVPLLLLLLALFDLRIELQLLIDHLTFTTLMMAIRSHLLAVVVLLLQPSLWRHYRRSPS